MRTRLRCAVHRHAVSCAVHAWKSSTLHWAGCGDTRRSLHRLQGASPDYKHQRSCTTVCLSSALVSASSSSGRGWPSWFARTTRIPTCARRNTHASRVARWTALERELSPGRTNPAQLAVTCASKQAFSPTQFFLAAAVDKIGAGKIPLRRSLQGQSKNIICFFSRTLLALTMRQEVSCAARFVATLLRRGEQEDERTTAFRDKLAELLMARYERHWHPEKPLRGSAYRCIRINHQPDPIISQAALACGFDQGALSERLPRELTLWIDPQDVSYRIGEDGSVCSLLESEQRVWRRPIVALLRRHGRSTRPWLWLLSFARHAAVSIFLVFWFLSDQIYPIFSVCSTCEAKPILVRHAILLKSIIPSRVLCPVHIEVNSVLYAQFHYCSSYAHSTFPSLSRLYSPK